MQQVRLLLQTEQGLSDRNLPYNRRENSVNSALTGKEGSPVLRRTTRLHNLTEISHTVKYLNRNTENTTKKET